MRRISPVVFALAMLVTGAEEAAAQAGCKDFLGRAKEQLCDARGYPACVEQLLKGALTVCLREGEPDTVMRAIARADAAAELEQRGCDREAVNEWACPDAALTYCLGYQSYLARAQVRGAPTGPQISPVGTCGKKISGDITVTVPPADDPTPSLDTAGAMALEGVAGTAGWGSWTSLGGAAIQGAPSLVRYKRDGQDAYFLAARGDKDELWWRTKVGTGGWTMWQNAGGIVKAAPSCVSRADDVVDCFVIGSNFRLQQRSYVKTAWTEWSNPDDALIIKGGLDAVTADADHVTVIAGGQLGGGGDLKAYALDWIGYATGSLTSTAGSAHGKPAPAYRSPGWRGWKEYTYWLGSDATAGFACDARYVGVAKGASGHAFTRLFSYGACASPDATSPPRTPSLWLFGGDRIKGSGLAHKVGGPLPGVTSDSPLDVRLVYTKADGVFAYVAFRAYPSNELIWGQYVFGKGWKPQSGKPFINLHGKLASAPTCVSGLCAARGADGTVVVTGK